MSAPRRTPMWSGWIMTALLAAHVIAVTAGYLLPPWMFQLTMVSASVWLCCVAEGERNRQRDTAPDADPIDWCSGCDQLRLRAEMGLNSIWLYRCYECRTGDRRHAECSLPPEQPCTHGPGCDCIETSRAVRRHFDLTTTTKEAP